MINMGFPAINHDFMDADSIDEGSREILINIEFLNWLESFDKIVIAGEARDYCVYESLKQMLEYYGNRLDILGKIYILEDCMSAIGDKAAVDQMYSDLQKVYQFNIVNSQQWSL